MSHCLKLMDKMSEDLEKLTKPPLPSSAVLPSVQPSSFHKAELSGFRNMMTQYIPGDATPPVSKGNPKQPVQSPKLTSQLVQSPQKQAPPLESLPLATLLQRFLLQQFHHWVQKARTLSSLDSRTMLKFVTMLHNVAHLSNLIAKRHSFSLQLTSQMMSNSVFRYLFEETPDGVNLEPYVHAKRLIWTTKGVPTILSLGLPTFTFLLLKAFIKIDSLHLQ